MAAGKVSSFDRMKDLAKELERSAFAAGAKSFSQNWTDDQINVAFEEWYAKIGGK